MKKTKLEETLERITSVLLEAQPATADAIATRLELPLPKVQQLLDEHTGRYVCEDGKYSVTQLPIEWHRGIRRNWIESMKLKSFEYIESDGSVSNHRPHRMHRFLEAFETFARDGLPRFLKEATLCKRLNVSIATLRRAIRDAEYCGLLKVEPHSGQVNRYEINWFTVKEVLLSDPETASLIDQTSRPKPPTKDIPTPIKLADTPIKLADTPIKLADTPIKLETTPINLHGVTSDRTSIRVHAGACAQQPAAVNQSLNQNTNQQQEDEPDADGFVARRLKTKPGDPWPHLETDHINRFPDLLNLFELWCSKKFHRVEPDQLQDVFVKFIALGRYLVFDGNFRSPAARFTQLVKTLPPDRWPGQREYAHWAHYLIAENTPEKVAKAKIERELARERARMRTAAEGISILRDDDPWTHCRQIVLVRTGTPRIEPAPKPFYPREERKALEEEFGEQLDALSDEDRFALFADRPSTQAYMEAHPEWFGRDGPQRDLLLTAFAQSLTQAVSSSPRKEADVYD